MTDKEAMKLAFDALEEGYKTHTPEFKRAIATLRQAIAQPVQPEINIDWQDMYQKEKRRSEMWISKYEKDIGPLEKAYPLAQPVQPKEQND